MGLRHDIIAALAKRHPEIVTIDDLMEATGETHRPRLVSNLKAAQTDDLITKTRDEVTNLPAYALTPTGLARHKVGGQQFNGKSQAENTGRAKPRSQPSPEKRSEPVENGLMEVIYDIRCAIGDPEGKIMLGDLAVAIRERYDAGKAYQAESERLSKKCHDLGNDVAGYAMNIGILRTILDIGPDDDVIEAVEALIAARAAPEEPPHSGKLALLLIDSAAMTDVEELDTADLVVAADEARRQIDVGNAARAVVIRIHGEAYRRTEWKEAS